MRLKVKKKNIEIALFILILLLIVLFRTLVLIKFGFKYTDSDQAIMWNGLNNFAEGHFHEPRFYGQNYNSMLEALFTVPFYKMGVPVYIALPIITSILTMFPYVFISFFTFRKKSTFIGLIILSIPLLMPIEYSLMTSLSRGFVTGIFVASIGLVSMFYTDRKWSFILFGFFSIMGYSVNANSVIIVLPCLLYLFLISRKNVHFYIFCGLGLIVGGLIHVLIYRFYIFNPGYVFHTYAFDFSFERLLESLGSLDSFFNGVAPIFWKHGFIWILFFGICSYYMFWKKNTVAGIFFLSIPILMILTTGIGKVHDGSNSVFFSISRMYLALPILICVSLSFIREIKIFYPYFLIPLFFLIYKTTQLENTINDCVDMNRTHEVKVAKVSYVLRECEKLSKMCDQNNVDLIVITDQRDYNFINYGCSSCTEDFPKTLGPKYERRTWRLIEDEKMRYKNVLIIGNLNAVHERLDFLQKIENTTDKFLIENNQFRTMELLDSVGLDVRKYK